MTVSAKVPDERKMTRSKKIKVDRGRAGVHTVRYGFNCWYTSKYVVYSSGVIRSW